MIVTNLRHIHRIPALLFLVCLFWSCTTVQTFIDKKDFSGAETFCESLEGDEKLRCSVQLGETFFASQDYNKAAKHYKIASYKAGYLKLAEYYFDKGDYETAAHFYAQSDSALAGYEKIGQAYFEGEKFVQSARYFGLGYADNPEELSKVYEKIALKYEEKRLFADAARYYEKIYTDDQEKLIHIYLRFVETNIKLGNYQYAEFFNKKSGEAKEVYAKIANAYLDKKTKYLRAYPVEDEGIYKATVSPDTRYLASVDKNHKIHIFDFKSGVELSTINQHSKPITDLIFSADSRSLLANDTKTVILWNLEKQEVKKKVTSKYSNTYHINSNAKSIEKKYFLSFSQNINLWDLEKEQIIKSFDTGFRNLNASVISVDSKYILAGGPKGFAVLWDIESGKEVGKYGTGTSGLSAVAISDDNTLVACAGYGQLLEVFEVGNTQPLVTLKNEAKKITQLQFSPGSKYLMTNDSGKNIIWNLKTGQKHRSVSRHSKFISDEWYILGNQRNDFDIYSIETGKSVGHFGPNPGYLTDVILVPEGDFFVAVRSGKAAYLWLKDSFYKIAADYFRKADQEVSGSFKIAEKALLNEDFDDAVYYLQKAGRTSAEANKYVGDIIIKNGIKDYTQSKYMRVRDLYQKANIANTDDIVLNLAIFDVTGGKSKQLNAFDLLTSKASLYTYEYLGYYHPEETVALNCFAMAMSINNIAFYNARGEQDKRNFFKKKNQELHQYVAQTFKPRLGEFTDQRDGRVYKTVTIGVQTWMAENLAFKPVTGSYVYDNSDENLKKYGRLYAWKSSLIGRHDIQYLAPAGWKVPSIADFEFLIHTLIYMDGKKGNEGGNIKSTSTLWLGENIGADNISGFSALPGGFFYNYYNKTKEFRDIGKRAAFWTSDLHKKYRNDAIGYEVTGSSDYLSSRMHSIQAGLSIRCIKQ